MPLYKCVQRFVSHSWVSCLIQLVRSWQLASEIDRTARSWHQVVWPWIVDRRHGDQLPVHTAVRSIRGGTTTTVARHGRAVRLIQQQQQTICMRQETQLSQYRWQTARRSCAGSSAVMRSCVGHAQCAYVAFTYDWSYASLHITRVKHSWRVNWRIFACVRMVLWYNAVTAFSSKSVSPNNTELMPAYTI